MKILFCGKDKFSYHRTRVLIEGLKNTKGIELSVLSVGGRNAGNAALLKTQSAEADVVLVPAFRHKDVKWVKKHSMAPVVFDPLISEYLTKVIDYRQWFKAPSKYLFDYSVLHAADYILADTEAMKEYYSRFFRIPANKIGVVPVGFISNDFKPLKREITDSRRVCFYGSFVPLQGSDIIAKSAHLLQKEQVSFDIIGHGATYADFLKIIQQNNLTNINLHGWLAYDQLSNAIAEADVCLGIFGKSGKATRVIPNKLFHYAAMQKCIITLESKAIREIFTPGENIITVDRNPQQLAEAIMHMLQNKKSSDDIAKKAHHVIAGSFNEKAIAERLVYLLQNWLS